MRVLLALGAVAVAVALVAIPVASATRPDVCLLTNAEVGKVLGGKIAGRTGGGSEKRGYSCTWTGPTLHGFFAVTRTAGIDFHRQTRAEFDREKARAAQNGAFIIGLKGIGVEAYENQGPVDEVDAWQRGYSLAVYTQEVVSPLESEKTLAKLALSRL